jgi:hypothetical protein
MAETKYGKYILRETRIEKSRPDISAMLSPVLEGVEDWAGIQHRISWKYISQPVVVVEEPHTHDYDEFLVFLPSDASNAQDFGAEVELSLGEEGEKYIINTTSVVCIPKGLIHCPLNFKKISKPILFCNVYISPEYVRKPVSK